ncbi:hypothetical protein C0Q70_03055 [Pomacea canaliculata]|uniref:Uncharacterized protein n=1 Tax=Pomacea canaliculata TaxID=400727 RepID=A0A2T7PRP4_POMCA|nr:hypothetical protein C0Q70_03055 [Pomacea canaliculata]
MRIAVLQRTRLTWEDIYCSFRPQGVCVHERCDRKTCSSVFKTNIKNYLTNHWIPSLSSIKLFFAADEKTRSRAYRCSLAHALLDTSGSRCAQTQQSAQSRSVRH